MSPEVKKLAERMEKELRDNAHKGDWRAFVDRSAIVFEIAWHQAKLLRAIRKDNVEKIAEYTADVCNLYLMLAMSAGAFTKSATSSCGGCGGYDDEY